MKRLDWNKLLIKDRLNAKSHDDTTDFDARTEFQRDFDRIIFSPPFRRLQDKTQVMPLPDSDYIRSRLTHSLEVSSLGRSMGKLVGKFVLENEPELKYSKITPDDFGNIISAACLAHDIGNPPFGHSGEKSIQKYFTTEFSSTNNSRYSELSNVEKKDLMNFEGNAAGFRLLTNNHPSGFNGGLRLSYAVLGAFTKYPRGSGEIKLNELGNSYSKVKNINDNGRKSQSKFGYFHSEAAIFEDVASKLGLLELTKKESESKAWCRHPLSFIMEAADSIAYHIIDFEDGHTLRLIPNKIVIDCLSEIVNRSTDERCVKNDWQELKSEDERVGALRSKALNQLIYECVEAFKSNYNEIMLGKFDLELLDVIESSVTLAKIKDEHTLENFYRHKSVIDTELAGFEVLGKLLGWFTKTLDNPKEDQNKRLLLKMPTHFSEKIKSKNENKYSKIMACVDHISRMTDSYALKLYRTLAGNFN